MKKLFAKRTLKMLLFIAIGIVCVWTLFPIWWAFLTSIKFRPDIYTKPPIYIPSKITLNFWKLAWFTRPIPYYYRNSLVIVSLSTVLALVIGIPAAYAIARLDFPGKKNIAVYILSTRMFPPITISIPIYLTMGRLNLLDTWFSLIIIYTVFNLSIVVLVLSTYFREIPREIEDAAKVDGCGSLQTFLKILLPIAKSGIVAVAILTAIFSWNEFLFAVLLTYSKASKTLPVGATEFIGGEEGVMWGPLCFVGLISILPIIIFALVVQRHLARGLTFGALR